MQASAGATANPTVAGCTIVRKEVRWRSASVPDARPSPSILVDVDRLVGGVLRRPARPGRPGPAGRVRDVRPSRLVAQRRLQRGAHRGHDRGDLPLPRRARARTGRCSSARDTHALSEPAFETALRGLVAHGVDVRVDAADGYTPTPVISHAILVHNRGRRDRLADGIVVTPSHNPPEDGGFKYNPPNGGPADTDVTGWIQDEANRLLEAGLDGVRQVAARGGARGRDRRTTSSAAYVDDLASVIDMDAIRASGLRLGVDPLGGASVAYWPAIGERYGLDLTVTNTTSTRSSRS